MHEMSLMENLLHTAESVMAEHEYSRINSITVAAGPLANIMPDAFQFAYETLTAETPFAGAELIVEKLPVKARCEACGNICESDRIPEICPACGASAMRITGGSEVYLTAIYFEEA